MFWFIFKKKTFIGLFTGFKTTNEPIRIDLQYLGLFFSIFNMVNHPKILLAEIKTVKIQKILNKAPIIKINS